MARVGSILEEGKHHTEAGNWRVFALMFSLAQGLNALPFKAFFRRICVDHTPRLLDQFGVVFLLLLELRFLLWKESGGSMGIKSNQVKSCDFHRIFAASTVDSP